MSDLSVLLAKVHERIGGVGLDIYTYGEDGGGVEVRWRRDDNGSLSDERFVEVHGLDLEAALAKVLEYEDEADLRDATEAFVADGGGS